jgi:hypothetical protein
MNLQSYYQKKSDKLVSKTKSFNEGKILLFKNKVTSIDMKYTKKKLNINPIKINSVINELL